MQFFIFHCPPSPPSLQEYVFRVDPLTSLGLSSDSIVCYRMGEVVRSHASEVPELLPCGYLVGDNNVIKVNLKGMAARKHFYFRITANVEARFGFPRKGFWSRVRYINLNLI